MKTLSSYLLFFFSFFLAQSAFAQTSIKDTLTVAGNCGMCKKKIESAAKSAGASFASWNSDNKKLVVTYNPDVVSAAKVQQAVAAVGYDTKEVKATDAAYKALHECCQYDRTALAKTTCCDAGECAKGDDCCKGANCCSDNACCTKGDAACCKEGKDCCKGGNCTHAAEAKQL